MESLGANEACSTLWLFSRNHVLDGTAGVAISDDQAPGVRAGRTIEAIKLAREKLGVGLKEAKDLVEALEQGGQDRGER